MDLNRIRLRSLMARYDLSIEDVAGLLNVAHQTVRHWCGNDSTRRISNVLLARLDLATYERAVATWPALAVRPNVNAAMVSPADGVGIATFFCPYCREEHWHLVFPDAEAHSIPPGSIGCRKGRWTPYLDHGYLLQY